MSRLTAKDFAPELLELYDFYAHGKISKREFLQRSAGFAAAGWTGGAILAALSPNYAWAQQVPANDPDIAADYINYPSPRGHGQVRGYLAKPAKADGKLPAVVVVHENRGLNPYIEDVARRLAKAGFVALAPDGLSSKGGYPGNDEEGREMQASLDAAKLMEDFVERYPTSTKRNSAFQDVAEEQDHGVVAHQYHPVSAAQVVQFAEYGSKPQRHVGPALPRGRAVVELPDVAATLGLGGELLADPLPRQPVEASQVAFTEPLVQDDLAVDVLHRAPGGLQGPGVRRGQHQVRQVVGLRHPLAERVCLAASLVGQLNVGVTGREVQPVRALLAGARDGYGLYGLGRVRARCRPQLGPSQSRNSTAVPFSSINSTSP